MTTFVHVGSHADRLASGALIVPGDRIDHGDLHAEDQHIVDEGRLVDLSSFDGEGNLLTGEQLRKRAGELEIEGRSAMSADDLRAAIAEREAQEAPDAA